MRQETLENFSFAVTMLAADATKTLLAARAGKRIVVTHLVYHVVTSAAQSCDVAAGSVVMKSIGISEAVGSEGFIGPMILGVPGQIGSALIATPSAAGYKIHFVGEGYYD